MITATEIDWTARQAAQAAYRAAWPDLFETVRDAMALGFWPDCYGGGPEPHGLMPPTKFGYPRAGLHAPFHVHGPGAGAAIQVWSFVHDSPDVIRTQPVWHSGPSHMHDLLGGGYGSSRSGLTFDAALAWAIGLGDYLQAHFVMPEHDPETRHPILAWAEWREVAAVSLPWDELAGQLSLFDPRDPATDRDPRVRARHAIREHLASHTLPDEVRIGMTGRRDAYGVLDLIALANARRLETGMAPPWADQEDMRGAA